ncbi:MAG: LamG domain-containing protein [Candidatus Aenigmatarchaeota archaeon]|nr:MAG: LamG domain-containing protein [Candidatus Aenigmarchaeota archaeon]
MNKKIILVIALTIFLLLAAFPMQVQAEQPSFFEMIQGFFFPQPQLESEVEHIKILNPISKPTLWGRWEVEFETRGRGDLEIDALEGTFFEKDIRFLWLYCGGKNIEVEKYFFQKFDDESFVEGIENGKIVARDWDCDERARLVLLILETGRHYLEYSFLGDTAYAENLANCTGTTASPCHMCDVDAMNVSVFSFEGSQVIGEVGSVSLNYSTWRTVYLENSYTTPVVVVNFHERVRDLNGSADPISVRVRNVGSSSFEARLQAANATAKPQTEKAYYMVMEEGVWILTDGTKVEAHNYTETHVKGAACTDNTWNTKYFSHYYSSAPVVFASVTSNHEANWTTDHVFILDEARFNISMELAEYCGLDPDHADEDMSWIAIEADVTSTVNCIDYETQTTGNVVAGHDNGCYDFPFSNTYDNTPLILWEMRTYNGGDGGWMVTCSLNTSFGGTHLEEDQFGDFERGHTTEEVSMIVFERAGNITGTYSSGPHSATYWKTDGSCAASPYYTNESWNYSLGHTFCTVEGYYNASISAHAEGDIYEWESSETSIPNNPMYTVNYDKDEDWCDCKVGATACNSNSCWNETNPMDWEAGADSDCCGDDSAEYYTYRIAHSSMDASFTTDSTDDACCNASSKCVANGVCYNDGENSTDADSDGDNDYCSSGTWWDYSTQITETISPIGDPVLPDSTMYVSGHIQLVNGTDVTDGPFNIWLNGSLLTMSNLTEHGTYDNDKSFMHTDSGDWDGGTFSNTTYDSENVTLTDTELDPETGMVGLWHLNDNDLSDSSGNDYNGTASGGVDCTGDEGKLDDGCYFDGTQSVYGNMSETLTTGLTLMVWFKAGVQTDTNPRLIEISTRGTSANSSAIVFGPGRVGTVRVWTECQTDGNRYADFVTASEYNDSQWHHAVYTYNSTAGVLYIDGAEIQNEFESCDNIEDAATFSIGGYYTGTSANLAGWADEAAVYTRALSASEVAEIYNKQRCGYYYCEGTFESEFMDAGAKVEWKNISWIEPYDYGHLEPDGDTLVSLTFSGSEGKEFSPGVGVVGLWHLNDNDTTDSSGNGNDCIQRLGLNCDGDDGVLDDGCDLDGVYGSGNYLDCGSDSSLNTSLEMSISAWVYPESGPSTQGRIAASTYQYQACGTDHAGWSFGAIWTVDRFDFTVYDCSGGVALARSDGGATGWFKNNNYTWHHVVGVFKAGEWASLHIDGILQENDTSSVPSYIYIEDPLMIGRRSAEAQSNWNGSIDEVIIWNRTLSEDEILDLYARGNANDSSFYDNDGQIIGPLQTEGVVGNALELDGGDDWVNITPDLGDPSEMTLALWFNKSNINEGSQYLMDGRYGGNWWFLQDYTSGACDDPNGNICFDSRVEVDSGNLSNNVWHHVVVTESSTETKIYLDGELMDTGAGEDPNLGVGVRIGTRYTGSAFFDGTIDEVAIYNTTLSASEVKDLYRRGFDLKFQARSCDDPDCDEISHNASGIYHFSGNEGVELSTETGMVGLWHLNDNDLSDSSCLGGDGVAYGGLDCTDDDGIFDDGCEFNGTNGVFINVSNNKNLDITNQITLETWLKGDPNQIATENIYPIGRENSYAMRVATAGPVPQYSFILRNSSNTAWWVLSTGANVIDNEWHHLVLTYNGSYMAAYIDGSLNATTALTDTIYVSRYDLCIGCYRSNYGTFNGTLDEVAIYNRALSGAEVLEHYQRGRANDSSENSNDGQIVGPLQADGVVGNALEFDGDDDYVSLGNPSSLQITGNLSICFWAYPKNMGAQRENPVDKAYGGEFALTFEDDPQPGMLSFFHGQAGGESSPYYYIQWDNVLTGNNEWTHVCVVRDVGGQSVKCYSNGAEIQSVTEDTWEDPSTSSEPVTIGWGYTNTFDGIIDEVVILNRSLSDSEIRQLYQRGLFTGPDRTHSTYYSNSSGEALSTPDNRYFQYKAFLESPNGNSTPYLEKVYVNYTAVVTDSSGDYNYSFTAPSSAGTYPVKINVTYAGIYGENLTNFDVENYIIDGGSGTTCNSANPCLYIKDSTGTGEIEARFDDNGYVDVKGDYASEQSSPSPPDDSFIIQDSGGTVVLYIDTNGNLNTTGKFIKQASPIPGGNNDFIIQDSTGAIAGYIDRLTGNMYFKGDLHYNSNF